MTYASDARGWSAGKIALVAVLAVVGVLVLVAAILFFTEPAKSLPSILHSTITHPAGRANAHRSTRGIVAIAVAVVLLVAAAITGRMGRSSR
jgi:hypothetical protein